MTEITANNQPDILVVQVEHLLDFLQKASVELRGGKDAEGIADLLSAETELENIVENGQTSLRSQIDWCRLLPAVRMLHFYIRNQDIAGIADLLEDTFCPMAGEWMKGCRDT